MQFLLMTRSNLFKGKQRSANSGVTMVTSLGKVPKETTMRKLAPGMILDELISQ